MNTTQRIFHHLRTDLHRNWQLLLLLTIGLAAFGAIDLIRHLQAPQRYHGELLTLAVFGFGCLMSLIVIHGDPATGSSPFWKTRPVRGMEVFCSKAIQILLIGFLMFAGWTAAPILSGFRNGVSWEFATIIPPLLIGIAAVAAVSRNLIQALLIGGGLWVGVFAVAWIWNLTTDQLPAFRKTEAMRETGLFLAAMTLAAGSFVVAFYQYLRRRQMPAIGALSAVSIAAFLVMQYNSTDLMTKRLNTAEEAALGVENASIILNPDPTTFQWGSHTVHTPTRVIEYVQLSANASVEGIPEGIFVAGTIVDGEMKNPESGTTFPSLSQDSRGRRPSLLAALVQGDFETLWEHRLPQETTHTASFLKIQKATYPSLTSQEWQFQGTATSQLSRMVPAQAIPFGEEAVFRHRGWSGSVLSKVEGSMTLRVDFQASMWRFGHRRELPGYAILIVNREQKKALASRGGGHGGGGSNRRWHTDTQATFPRQIWRDQERIEIGDDWLADAEVVIYVEEFLGTIQRPVTIDPLKLPEVEMD